MNRIQIVPVVNPPAAYDVIVEAGALDRLPSLLAEAAPGHHYRIIADRNLADRYGQGLASALGAAGFRLTLLSFDAGESEKTRETWAELTDACIASGAGRDSVVLALGGGVTGDLAGFVAATFLRGVPIVQLPTSLLAMVDSAVGGKTGVDTPAGKNLVGAFHTPNLVVADPLVLETLPLDELRAGLAEAIKHGAVADPAYLDWIGQAAPRLLARDADALTDLVRRSVEIKAEVTAADPFETGPRKALNFGHTIGHAIEAVGGYEIAHGFAVSIGMVVEARLGEASGITEPGTGDRLARVLTRLGLPVLIPARYPAARIVELARTDKKARGGRTRYTLIERIGEVARTGAGEWSHELDDATVLSALAVSADGSAV